MDSLNRNSREKGKLYAFLFFLRIICAKITFARSNNNYKLSFIHYFPNFKFLGRVYEKKMLLFLCVYLVALVLMGITIQLYIKFYLSAVDMNIPKISKNTKRSGMIERFSYKKENLLNRFIYVFEILCTIAIAMFASCEILTSSSGWSLM